MSNILLRSVLSFFFIIQSNYHSFVHRLKVCSFITTESIHTRNSNEQNEKSKMRKNRIKQNFIYKKPKYIIKKENFCFFFIPTQNISHLIPHWIKQQQNSIYHFIFIYYFFLPLFSVHTTNESYTKPKHLSLSSLLLIVIFNPFYCRTHNEAKSFTYDFNFWHSFSYIQSIFATSANINEK